MIDLYTWTTPNGRKVSIALEEMGLAYKVHTINIGKDEQFAPAFLEIAPNNRIPAIVDSDGPDGRPVSVFETGAILLYLAEKTGQFMPTDSRKRIAVYEWLMWQMGGYGPMLGQAHHFLRYNVGKAPYAEDRYRNETLRLYGVLDRRLADHTFVAGDEYTIADMAIYPWTARHEWHQAPLDDFTHVKRWSDQLGQRTAVQKGMDTPPVQT
jgi:GST-like protein